MASALQTTSKILPPLLEDPVRRLVAHISSGAPRTLVALVGLPGAGKSTLALALEEAVKRQLGHGAMVVLGMDGFHLTKAQLKQLPNPEQALLRRGAPWTFDTSLMTQRLEMIRHNVGCESVWWPDFQHDVGEPIENAIEISASARLVLVEGLYLLHQGDGWDQVQRQFDEHWYLDTPLETALERLTLRHMSAWQMTRDEAKRRIEANDYLNACTVMDSRSRADWFLCGDEPSVAHLV